MRIGDSVLVLVILLSTLFSAVVLPVAARAEVYLELAPDPSGNSCEIADPGPNGVVTVYVLAKGSLGDTGFHFSAPVPASSGLVHVSDQSSYYIVGNSQSTIDVGFGSCLFGDFVVMQMEFYRASPGDACTFYPVSAGAFHVSCLFEDLPIQTAGVMFNSDGTCNQARNVAPADGATNVPLTTALSWTPGYTCELEGSRLIFFGTTPNPPQVAYDVTSPYAVGPLQPGTKYYWKIADPGAGPVWSFTTTTVVATTPSTWGAIKALYR